MCKKASHKLVQKQRDDARKALEKYEAELNNIYAKFGGIENWENPVFDWKKAYFSSIIAKLPYLRIPDFELKRADRANLIPCESYRYLIQEQTRSEYVEDLLSRSDINESSRFFVENRYVVAIIVKIREVVFISLRGTILFHLNDWLTNFHICRSRVDGYKNSEMYFHKGFYLAIQSCIDDIHSNIIDRFGTENTIYITGHSLGGALAAILHSLWNQTNKIPYPFQKPYLDACACYTFGMPRYGNTLAVSELAKPFHIYNESDIVPTVPPRSFGFDGSLEGYGFTLTRKLEGGIKKIDQAEVKEGKVKGSYLLQYIYKFVTCKGIKAHYMELYIDAIKLICQQQVVEHKEEQEEPIHQLITDLKRITELLSVFDISEQLKTKEQYEDWLRELEILGSVLLNELGYRKSRQRGTVSKEVWERERMPQVKRTNSPRQTTPLPSLPSRDESEA